jgi:hypothetical protein
MSAMTGAAKYLRYTAFTLMVLFGLVGGLFVAGETFTDPGGWTAVWLTALWALPMLGLVAYALVRKERAGPLFVVLAVLVGAFTLLDEAVGIVPTDETGPVAVVTVFSLSVATAFLGLYRATLAGLLMVTLAVVQLASLVIGQVARGSLEEGPPLGAMLGGSSGVVVIPLLVIGALFLVAGTLGHERLRPGHLPPMRSAH